MHNIVYQFPASFGCFTMTCSKSHFSQIPLQSSNQPLCLSIGPWPDHKTEAGVSAKDELKQKEAKANLAVKSAWFNTLGS